MMVFGILIVVAMTLCSCASGIDTCQCGSPYVAERERAIDDCLVKWRADSTGLKGWRCCCWPVIEATHFNKTGITEATLFTLLGPPNETHAGIYNPSDPASFQASSAFRTHIYRLKWWPSFDDETAVPAEDLVILYDAERGEVVEMRGFTYEVEGGGKDE